MKKSPFFQKVDLKGATVKRDKDGNLIYTTKSGKTFTHTDISEKLIKETKKDAPVKNYKKGYYGVK